MKKAVRECGSDGKPTHRDAALPNTEPRSLDCRAVPPRKPTDRPTILDSYPHPPLPSHPSHTYIPFHSPACLIRQHHQPLSGNAALLHPSGPQCSPTTYGLTLLPHLLLSFLPTFFLEFNRSIPFLLLFTRYRSFSRNLLLSLFVSSLIVLLISMPRTITTNLPFIFLS